MVTAVVGANWGDEGKGKITDMLGEESDIIVRFQGGSNAGHTIVNDYGKFALHILPSGVFYNHTTSIIGNGVALNIPDLFKEIQGIVDRGVPMPKILVSDRAQIVMPYHILFDQYEEERLGGRSFGSTKSGIAPFYSDKYAKIGIQVCDLFHEDVLRERLEQAAEITDAYRGGGWGENTEESQQAVLSFARSEGIFIENVYTSKVLVGMMDWIEQKKVSGPVCYLHTGGLGSLFAQY